MYTITLIACDKFQRSAFSGIREFFESVNSNAEKIIGKKIFNLLLASKDGQQVQDNLARPTRSIAYKVTDISSCNAIIFLGSTKLYSIKELKGSLDTSARHWLTKQNNKNTLIASIFSATFILAEANILSNKSFAICHTHQKEFSHRYPHLNPNTSGSIIIDSNIYTGCTIASWLEISIQIVKQLLNDEAESILPNLPTSIFTTPSGRQINNQRKTEIYTPEFIKKVTKIVNNDKNSNIKIKRLASLMFISERTLSRKIKEYTNNTPKIFLDNIRIAKACELLKTTEKSIKEITFLSGFNSSISFRRSFKKKMKKNPSEYRFSHTGNRKGETKIKLYQIFDTTD